MSEEMRVKLYNTETRSKAEVKPSFGEAILLYTCGPTVYNFAHIGNFRTYIFEDILRRTLEFFGMRVVQVMNLTDVDDKTIKGALEQKQTLLDYTKPYIEAFFQDLEVLGIEKAEHYPAATDYIKDMILLIQKLLDKGAAYVGEDKSVYFRIAAFPSYGRLSHLDLSALKAGASNRTSDEYEKDQVCDFVLWKAYEESRDGYIFWDSPFGRGRPGWHIECSAMAMKILGESIDIHVGGVDNMFPHHENEIAQCEACSGKLFVKHWLHAEHLLVDHKKMSKSLGNFYTLRDLLDRGYTGQQIRYALLQTHYRTQLNFTFDVLDAANASIQRILDFMDRMRAIKDGPSSGLAISIAKQMKTHFQAALGDDLNISLALSFLFESIRELHTLCDRKEMGKEEAKAVIAIFEEIDQILGLFPLSREEAIPALLLEALEKRQEARQSGDWATADACRELIVSHGYRIEDSPEGVRLKKQRK